MHSLSSLALKIEEAFIEKKDVLAVFLDVQGAFDNVHIDILLSILAEIGCSDQVLNFIKFLTHERHIFSENIKNGYTLVYKGVLQGGVLSPLLYRYTMISSTLL